MALNIIRLESGVILVTPISKKTSRISPSRKLDIFHKIMMKMKQVCEPTALKVLGRARSVGRAPERRGCCCWGFEDEEEFVRRELLCEE